MIEIQAPNPIELTCNSIFLAGSIEMGNAEKWQDMVIASNMTRYLQKKFWRILTEVL